MSGDFWLKVMTVLTLIHFVPLFALLVVAAGVDMRHRRIPNWVTLSMAIGGLIQSFTHDHTVTPVQSFAGLGVGFLLPLVLFVLNAIGGGDVKLLAAVGAWIGPMNIVLVFILKDMIGLILVLAQATYQGRLRSLFKNSAVVALNLLHVREVGIATVQQVGLSCKSVDKPLPMAVPILFAVASLLWLRIGGI